MAWCGRYQTFLLPDKGSGITNYGKLQTGYIISVVLLLPLYPSSGCPSVCSCSSGEVNCMDRELRLVPDNLPANATTILLDYNSIAVLQNRTFLAQHVLQRLSLHSNLIVSVHRQALVGLGELQELDLSGNSLSNLPPEAFLPVPRLTVLNLGNNKLLSLDPELLGALPHLQTLSLHSNALTSLSSAFFENLPPLHSFKLDNNPWVCTCDIQPLFQWLTDNVDTVPEVKSVRCRLPAPLAQYPIIDIGNESFAPCHEPWLLPQDYAFFLLIGPSTFLTSICMCLLVGFLAVACVKMLTGSYTYHGPPATRAERQRVHQYVHK
ncbi:leucine-rich repeat-containing protein 26-like [Eublepharis macularius]|uniref:Leucine-rich repeat-containing protein 26 n=1 Tax=Eublepharis macularius TaxID=481883 RepID=A0AA97LG26_EUBMA|nr:leucine-rich repeat-containing protein 26 [Eublepharis macularius]XP_054859981.1 leucine-rich repeat-containing protein 26-like [Eublepharis macularius]